MLDTSSIALRLIRLNCGAVVLLKVMVVQVSVVETWVDL